MKVYSGVSEDVIHPANFNNHNAETEHCKNYTDLRKPKHVTKRELMIYLEFKL